VVALGFGTQLPDLIDKPLAWYVHVLPYGRSFAHSVLTGGVVLLVVAVLLDRRAGRATAAAFAVGYLSHLVGDAYASVVTANWADLAFLVWPVLPIPNVESELEGVIAHLRNIEGSPFFLFGLLLTALALGLWYRHGLPGLRELLGVLLPADAEGDPQAK
jgi:hypothetical protein